MNYTNKKSQRITLKEFTDEWVNDFEKNYPTKTIGNHHYIRKRHLQQFLYDYTDTVLRSIKNNIINFD